MGAGVNPWESEPAPRPEARWNRLGGEYEAWNAYSPETAFCQLVGALVALARPVLVVETGVGQGYVTRRIRAALPASSSYVGFESNDEWRAIAKPFLAELSAAASPHPELLAAADMVVLDSDPPFRQAELAAWLDRGRSGSLGVVHDVIPGHYGLKLELADLLAAAGGLFTPNPRGGWVGRHP